MKLKNNKKGQLFLLPFAVLVILAIALGGSVFATALSIALNMKTIAIVIGLVIGLLIIVKIMRR